MNTDTLASIQPGSVTWNLIWCLPFAFIFGVFIYGYYSIKRIRSAADPLIEEYKIRPPEVPPVDVVNHPAAVLFTGEPIVFTPDARGPVALPQLVQVAGHYGYYYVGDRPSRWTRYKVEHVFVRSSTPPPLPVPQLRQRWGYGP